MEFAFEVSQGDLSRITLLIDGTAIKLHIFFGLSVESESCGDAPHHIIGPVFGER